MAERQNRWLTIIAIAIVIMLIIAAAGGPAVIRDAAMEMFDENNDERSALPSDTFAYANNDGIDMELRQNITWL